MTAQLLKRGPLHIGPVGWSQRDYYRVDPPIEGHAIVAVSRALICGEPETYIFAAGDDLADIGDCELEGSRKGNIKPAALLRELGYTVNEGAE